LSGLTKKSVYADSLLSKILGVREGDLVSYADISKGLSKYIADLKLRGVSAEVQPVPSQEGGEAEPLNSMQTRRCRDCGDEIPYDAVFCDLCGVSQ
jgi:hypothetical protein